MASGQMCTRGEGASPAAFPDLWAQLSLKRDALSKTRCLIAGSLTFGNKTVFSFLLRNKS